MVFVHGRSDLTNPPRQEALYVYVIFSPFQKSFVTLHIVGPLKSRQDLHMVYVSPLQLGKIFNIPKRMPF